MTARDVDQLLEHVPWVRALALQLCRDAERADDASQTTFLAAARQPPQRLASMRSYLARILRNALHHDARSSRRRGEREAATAELRADVPHDPLELAARAELHAQLVAEVLQLPDAQREAVLLHYFEGLDVAQVATRTGRSADAIRAVLRRARDELRQRLERRGCKPSFAALALPASAALLTMKYKLVAVAAVVVGAGWFAIPAWISAPVPEAPVQTTHGTAEREQIPATDPSATAEHRTVAPQTGRLLRGQLVGGDRRMPWSATLKVTATWRDADTRAGHRTTAEVTSGTFEIQLPSWRDGSSALQLHVTGTDAGYEALDAALTPADAAVEFEVLVVPAPLLSGRIGDASGAPVEDATLWFFATTSGVPQTPRLGEVRTDADGNWQLRLPANGELLIAAIPPAALVRTIPTCFPATVNGHSDAGDLQLPDAALVTGTVLWSDGSVAADAEVEWRSRAAVVLDRESGLGWSDGRLVQRRKATTDTAGTFALRAHAGEPGAVLLSRAAGCLPATMHTVRATAPQQVELRIAGHPVTIRVLRDGEPAGLSGIEWRRERFAGNYGTDENGVLRQLVLDEPLRMRAVSLDRQFASEWSSFENGVPAEVALHLQPVDGEPVGVRLQGAEFHRIGFSWKPRVGDGPRRSVTATATDGRFVVRIPAGGHRLRLHGAVGNATELLLPTEVDIDVPSAGDVVVPVRLGGRLRLSVTDTAGKFLAGRYRLTQNGVDVAPPGFGDRGVAAAASRMLPEGAQHDTGVHEPGSYELVVELSVAGEHRRQVTIVAGETREVRIAVP